MTEPKPVPLRSLDWVSKRLDVHPQFVRQLVADGNLPALRLGDSLRFDERDVEQWIAAEKKLIASA